MNTGFLNFQVLQDFAGVFFKFTCLTFDKTVDFLPGAHRPIGFQEPDEALRPLKRDQGPQIFNTRDTKRASEMESFLVWDATRASSPIFETAAYPCLAAASKDDRFENAVDQPKNRRGKWEVLHRAGLVLENSPSVKWVLCDGHGSHQWLHALLLGLPIDLPDILMEHLPFWNRLTYRSLPMVCFPLPWRNALIDNVCIHYIPGGWHGWFSIVQLFAFQVFALFPQFLVIFSAGNMRGISIQTPLTT